MSQIPKIGDVVGNRAERHCELYVVVEQFPDAGVSKMVDRRGKIHKTWTEDLHVVTKYIAKGHYREAFSHLVYPNMKPLTPIQIENMRKNDLEAEKYVHIVVDENDFWLLPGNVTLTPVVNAAKKLGIKVRMPILNRR